MYLTLVAVAADLSSFTWKRVSTFDPTTYTHGILNYKKYLDDAYELFAQLLSGDSNWTALMGDGLAIEKEATDGVHMFQFQYAKTVAGVESTSGVMTGAGSLVGAKYISEVSDPYTLYPLTTAGVATGLPDGTRDILVWYEDANNTLVTYTTEKALAEDIRKRATLSCEAVEKLMPRYLDLLSAVALFNCKDYKGAEWLISSDSSTSSNCGC